MQLKRLLKATAAPGRVHEVLRCRRLFPEWKKLTKSYLGFKVEYPFYLTLPTGQFEFRTWNDVRTFWLVWCACTYPVAESDQVIVDAGANIGSFTVYALIKAPRSIVIAVEPAPDTFDRLRTMIVSNGCQSRCTLVHAALGRTEGTTMIDLRPESQFRQIGQGITQVPQIALDSVLERPVDLLKMDIEGAELEAVMGSELNKVRRIAMEFHPSVELANLTAALDRRGFKIETVREDGGGYGILHASANSNHASETGSAT